MAEAFSGRWELRVTAKNAGFAHRLRVVGATSGSGTYAGSPGVTAVVDGPAWSVFLEWNDEAGSGWQESAVARSAGAITPLIAVEELRADDNVPALRDHDFDDLVVSCVSLQPVFDVVRRPAALDRGTLTLFPDGIFEASQGVCYMAVRVRNTGPADWQAGDDVRLTISTTGRAELASGRIYVLDAWTAGEEQALGQRVVAGGVALGFMPVGGERTAYFKVDVSGARASKPSVRFALQAALGHPAHEAPDRTVARPIFVSRSTYDPVRRELVADVPEGRLHLRLTEVLLERAGMQAAMKEALRRPCGSPPRLSDPVGRPEADGGRRRRGRNADRDELRGLLAAVLAGERVDVERLRDLIGCCDHGSRAGDRDCAHERYDRERSGSDRTEPTEPGHGGLADGSGSDDWCRVRPVPWLPIAFEYRLVPNPAYADQFGPLAFGDPWWKVVLIIVAVLLAIASVIYDYIAAGQDPDFVIGTIAAKSDRRTNGVDAAVALLNSSRGRDFGVLEAQADDRNNGQPVGGPTGGTIALDRTDNGNRGVADAVVGNVVFKSGARSATTRGSVSSIGLNTNVEGIPYTNQVLVVPLAAPANQPLSQAGDSGSLWVDLASRRPVALNFAGPISDDGSQGIANPIRRVVEFLDLHFQT